MRNYKRVVHLTVTGQKGTFDFSTVRVRFLVKHDINETPNLLEATIYNLSNDTAERFVNSPLGAQVVLQAGYESNVGTVFTGNLIFMRKGRENPTDTIVQLWAGDGDYAYSNATVSKTHAAGSTPQDHWNTLTKAMEPFGVSAGQVLGVDLSTPKYPRAFTLFGMVHQALRTLAESKQASWFIHMGQVHLIGDKSAGPQGDVIVLNSMTGLIGMPVESPSGIIVRALINSKFGRTVAGTLLQINQSSIQQAAQFIPPASAGFIPGTPVTDPKQSLILQNLGTKDGIYRVLFAEWNGDSRGDPWYCDMHCIGAITGQVPMTLMQDKYHFIPLPQLSGPTQ